MYFVLFDPVDENVFVQEPGDYYDWIGGLSFLKETEKELFAVFHYCTRLHIKRILMKENQEILEQRSLTCALLLVC